MLSKLRMMEKLWAERAPKRLPLIHLQALILSPAMSSVISFFSADLMPVPLQSTQPDGFPPSRSRPKMGVSEQAAIDQD